MKGITVLSLDPIVENGISFWRIPNDINGNPQYIFPRNVLFEGETSIETKYEMATKSAMKRIGAKVYKQCSFYCKIQSYNLKKTADYIKENAYKMREDEE